MVSSLLSYRKIFRLIFVIFSLYLLGDAFFRWDGFSYYASFSEFLPSVALITILWTVVGLFAAILIWIPLRWIEWFCLRNGWKIRMNHLIMSLGVLVLAGVAAWKGKKLFWPLEQTTFQLKSLVFICVIFFTIILTWRFHNKFDSWMKIIQQRITPLVWLFGIWIVFSVPLVAYHTWGKETDEVALQEIFQSSIVDKNQPNIILVTLDALTVRDMSVYGYHRPTTPFISKWAKTASLFTKVQAESNFTTSTVASLMTGKRVWSHHTYHIKGSKPLNSKIESLPLLLKNDGYYTMALIQNPKASVRILGIADNFNMVPIASAFRTPGSLLGGLDNILYKLFGTKIRLYDWIIQGDFIFFRLLNKFSQDISETEVSPENVFNRFLGVINDNIPEPFFAWIHLLPPHTPYLPPESFAGMFDSSSGLRTDKSQMSVLLMKQKQHNKAIVNTFRARYDEFIRYCDKQFEDFINQLTVMNKLQNTVIILSSDHGESFEHNYFTHGGPHLYEQVTHIPLIIKEPEQKERHVIDDLVEQVDIPPTILELAEIPVPSWMEGRSIVSLMRGEKLQSKPAFSMNFETNPSRGHQITKGTIAVWEGDYKQIHYLEEKKSLLFNLKDDPGELNNLFDKESEVGQRLLTLIQDNLKKANERISRGE